jgi:hypothetical protein
MRTPIATTNTLSQTQVICILFQRIKMLTVPLLGYAVRYGDISDKILNITGGRSQRSLYPKRVIREAKGNKVPRMNIEIQRTATSANSYEPGKISRCDRLYTCTWNQVFEVLSRVTSSPPHYQH